MEPDIFVPAIFDELFVYPLGQLCCLSTMLLLHFKIALSSGVVDLLSTLSLPTYIKADGVTVLDEK